MPSGQKSKLIDKCDALYILHKDTLYKIALAAVGGDKAWALKILEKCVTTACENADRFREENSERTKAIMTAILLWEINKIYSEVWEKMETAPPKQKKNATKKDKVDADQILIRNELTANLAKYVAKLSNADKELIFKRFFIGLAEEEMAKLAGEKQEETGKKILMVKQKIANMMAEG